MKGPSGEVLFECECDLVDRMHNKLLKIELGKREWF